ncbi:MAG: cupin domain-containing protein [Candidatus Hodarchaeales archaeon]
MKNSVPTIKFNLEKINQELGDKFWSPIDVIRMNEYVLRAAAVKGEFHWHSHEEDDEFFLVHQGEITIDTEKGPIELKTGEGTVIPKGMQHKPRSNERSIILLLEPLRVKSKGD